MDCRNGHKDPARYPNGTCKQCAMDKAAKYRSANPEKTRERENKRAKERSLEIKSSTFRAYGNRCACCGESQPEFLCIDHVTDDGKDHRRKINPSGNNSSGGGRMYRWARLNGYPESLQLLCHNCNMAKAQGVCPHQLSKKGTDTLRNGTLTVVVGGQLGSEAKGHTTGMLINPKRVGDKAIGVRVGGSNAGHIVYGVCPKPCNEPAEVHSFGGREIGHPWRLRSVPVAAVTNEKALLVIAAGSEVDLSVLHQELQELDSAGYNATARLVVDEQATWLEHIHVEQEQASDLTARLGSTAKGIGAARADRIWRTARLVGDATNLGLAKFNTDVSTAWHVSELMSSGYDVVIEGTQGYGLGLHAGFYPQTTSGDCRAIDFLAQAGISPWAAEVRRFKVWVVCRVRPIRVAGNSGPLKDETSWSELGLPEEHTTVTKKVRRVGGWDPSLVRAAVYANGGSVDPDSPVQVALTMLDTVFPEVAFCENMDKLSKKTREQVTRYVNDKEAEIECAIHWVGTSPVTGMWVV